MCIEIRTDKCSSRVVWNFTRCILTTEVWQLAEIPRTPTNGPTRGRAYYMPCQPSAVANQVPSQLMRKTGKSKFNCHQTSLFFHTRGAVPSAYEKWKIIKDRRYWLSVIRYPFNLCRKRNLFQFAMSKCQWTQKPWKPYSPSNLSVILNPMYCSSKYS